MLFPGASPVVRYTFANSAAAENGFDKHAFASTKIALCEIFPGPNSTLGTLNPKKPNLRMNDFSQTSMTPVAVLTSLATHTRIQYLRRINLFSSL